MNSKMDRNGCCCSKRLLITSSCKTHTHTRTNKFNLARLSRFHAGKHYGVLTHSLTQFLLQPLFLSIHFSLCFSSFFLMLKPPVSFCPPWFLYFPTSVFLTDYGVQKDHTEGMKEAVRMQKTVFILKLSVDRCTGEQQVLEARN
ncbi:hypothetical protein CHARACLAT_033009 [Characodon lateralis]|uniref:Uncharacterized protein n=1 Tax=Characodon lateralis TaxID=208331 RepID=A0ABU7CWN5_9TELE|nr:hypothetical protein [Characodon lateralis]